MSLARTRIAVRLLAVAALAALTAGCFQPMYAEHSDGTSGLREKLMGVEIPPVDKPNASREALFLSTGGTSTPISFSRRPGEPSACSAYIG